MDWQILTNDMAGLAIGKMINNNFKAKEAILKSYVGTYEDGRLSVETANPHDRLPKVELYANSENEYYLREAALTFLIYKRHKRSFQNNYLQQSWQRR